jgi:hypothetical protein
VGLLGTSVTDLIPNCRTECPLDDCVKFNLMSAFGKYGLEDEPSMTCYTDEDIGLRHSSVMCLYAGRCLYKVGGGFSLRGDDPPASAFAFYLRVLDRAPE